MSYYSCTRHICKYRQKVNLICIKQDLFSFKITWEIDTPIIGDRNKQFVFIDVGIDLFIFDKFSRISFMKRKSFEN